MSVYQQAQLDLINDLLQFNDTAEIKANLAWRKKLILADAMPAPEYTLALDDYEAENLRTALEVIATTPAVAAMNTGDWVNQIRYKLPQQTGTIPNCRAKEQGVALGSRVQKVIKDFLADPNSDPGPLRRLLAEAKR